MFETQGKVSKSNPLKMNKNLKGRKYYLVLASIISILGLGSCANDIDIFTDYKEQAVVYGLLDLGQPVQYLKVGRTFLNPNATAAQVAQISDSLYFKNVIVKLIDESNNKEIIFNKVDSIPKDSGFFQNKENILFASAEQLNPTSSYRLFIQNTETGYTATGKTLIVGMPMVTFPVSLNNRFWSVAPDMSIQLRFSNGNNAKQQDAYFEFWVEDFDPSNPSSKELKFLRWRFVRNLKNETTTPGARVNVSQGSGFYEFFLSNIENGVFNPDSNYIRRIVKTDFVLYSASQDLVDYVDAATPGIGIVQKQTEFSNIDNGMGLFSSRSTLRIPNIIIDSASIDFFNSNRFPQYNVVRMRN